MLYKEARDLADCLRQVLVNSTEGSCVLTKKDISECVILVYGALWSGLWLERNVAAIHALLVNRPNARMVRPTDSGENVIEHFLRPISTEQYVLPSGCPHSSPSPSPFTPPHPHKPSSSARCARTVVPVLCCGP